MNRVIKFRAWDTEKDKIIGVCDGLHICVNDGVIVLVQYLPDGKGMYSPNKPKQLTWPEADNLEVMQFTGMRDKNEKEIWEGDIILGDYWSFGSKKRKQYEVKYLPDEFGYNIGGIEEIEVIGNIYQNPNLLET